MHRYVIKRALQIIPIMFGAIFIVFSIMYFTPGDPGTNLLGPSAEQYQIDELNHQLGYDRPFAERFIDYILGVLQGDFGNSYRTKRPVFEEIWNRFPHSLRLSVSALTLASIIGVGVGIISAVKQYSIIDMVSTITALVMSSLPSFWLGLMLILFFSAKLGWLPASGIGSFKHYVLPTICLAMPTASRLLRMTRSTMLETVRQDYIRTAKTKGASGISIIFKHALRNALMPIITVMGTQFGVMMGSTIVMESVFSIPGLGSLVLNSIRAKDIPQAMAAIIFLSFISCAVMFFVDILYAFIDPRIRSRYVSKN